MNKTLITLSLICGLLLLPHTAFAETKSQAKKREQAEQQRLQRKVTKVLQGERMGVIPDRQKALKALIDSGNAPDEAYWQAGYIKKGDQWVSVEQRWLDRDEEAKLDEYAKVRNPAWNTPEANYELAKWCDQHGLHEQARAHLMSILLDHPDNAQLRQMLGYQKIGNRWMNEEEFNAEVEASERLAKNLQKWGPVVAEIRAGLDSGDTRKQNAAKVKLEQIDDLDAIPAFKLILLSGSEQAASACVSQLCTMKNRDATLALCQAEMFLPDNFRSVKELAIKELKERPPEDFVSTLLMETSSPMSYRLQILHHQSQIMPDNQTWRNSLGRVDRHVDQYIVQVSGSSESLLSNKTYTHTQITSITSNKLAANLGFISPGNPSSIIVPGESGERSSRILSDSIRAGEKSIAEISDRQLELNQMICDLLSDVTSLSHFEKPEDWWNWWNQYQERSIDRKFDQSSEIVEFDAHEFDDIEFVPASSCFVAGTPVWTDRGPRPIEKLHIGDIVLTKDVETGELAYKPIIRATVREPKPLVTIDLGPEQITATGGHPFWVSGTGWVRARELKAGQRLHTPTGSIEIESVTESDERETYNLVVDGFHTYFVGQSQLLCHDVSITSPTDAVVPGLIER